jgi:hypothetical protein
MNRTNKERILDYLWSISPDRATNSQIREKTGINSHQQVYMLTRELMGARLIRGVQHGREWVFWADEALSTQLASPGQVRMREALAQAEVQLSPRAFEDLARLVMSNYFGVLLKPGQVSGVPKEFDLVSPDGSIVGDAKYFTLVRGQRLPPATDAFYPRSPSSRSTSGYWKESARQPRSLSLGTIGMCHCYGWSVTVTWWAMSLSTF